MSERPHLKRLLLHILSVPMSVLGVAVFWFMGMVALVAYHRAIGDTAWLPDRFDAGFWLGVILLPTVRLVDWLFGLSPTDGNLKKE